MDDSVFSVPLTHSSNTGREEHRVFLTVPGLEVEDINQFLRSTFQVDGNVVGIGKCLLIV